MKKREQVFDHPSQLNALSSAPFVRINGLHTLQLGGRISEHFERERWEDELNKYYYACGCNESAQALIIGLIVGSVWAGYAYFKGIHGV